MSEAPRAEDVREALEIWDSDGKGEYLDFSEVERLTTLFAAAARACLASQATTEGRYVEPTGSSEQTPDYEAAAKAVVSVAGTGLGEDGYVKVWVDQHAEIIAQAAVDAALVGFHPQPESPEVPT